MTQRYCASFTPAQANGASGFFSVTLNNVGTASYLYKLDLTQVTSTCPFQTAGFNYHLHTIWPTSTTSLSAQGTAGCAAGLTGGHFDPLLACSGASPLCNALNRTAKSYSCSPSIFAQTPSRCEIGDISGKFGMAMATGTGVFDQSKVPLVDSYAPSPSAYQYQAVGNNPLSAAQLYWTSVVFHCGTDNSRFLCGKLVPVAAGATSPCTFADSLVTPTVPASSPTSSPACFAGTERVTLHNGTAKAMADVAVGDRVLTVNAQGEQVYADVAYLPHGQNAAKAVFTVLATASGRDLKMTANHMLPAGACDAASLPVVAASAVVVGDCVQTVSGREQVVSVSTADGEGIYTAIAMEELLVVNGIVATPYGGVNPVLANWYYNLHRLAYSVAGKALLAVQGATEGVWAALTLLAASR